MIKITPTPIVRIAGSCLSVWAIPAAVAYGMWTETMTYLLAMVVGGLITLGWNGLGALRRSSISPAERHTLISGGAFGLAVAVAAWIIQQRQPWLGMPPNSAGPCVALALLATPLAGSLTRTWRSRSNGAALALMGLGILGTLLLATASQGWGLRFAYCTPFTSGLLVGTTLTLLACRGFLGSAGTRMTRRSGPLLPFAYGAISLLFLLILLGHIHSKEQWFITFTGAAFALWLGGAMLRRLQPYRWLTWIIAVIGWAALAGYGLIGSTKQWLDLGDMLFLGGWVVSSVLFIVSSVGLLGRRMIRLYRHRPRWPRLQESLAKGLIVIVVAPVVVFVWVGLSTTDRQITNSRLFVTLEAITGKHLLNEKEFLKRLMRDEYLWREHVTEAQAGDASQSLDQLLDRLKYKERDRWSYLVSAKDERAWREGIYRGIGVRWKADDGSSWTAAYVHSASPAEQAGIQRGDELTAINGVPLPEIEAGNQWNTVIHSGQDNRFTFRKTDGTLQSADLRGKEIQVHSVFQRDVIRQQEEVIGYLVLNQFIPPSYRELGKAFAALHDQGITELILDLRYNGGGQVDMANQLAGLIGGPRTAGQVFARLKYNQRYGFEETMVMQGADFALGLSRLVVITAGGTCSASEMMINGLRPYLDVVTVGSTTCGKPVGMRSIAFHDYVIHPIGFEVVNAWNEGGYFDGLRPTCAAQDDLRHALGDPQEESLKEALYYLRHGRCAIRLQLRGMDNRRAQDGREPGMSGFHQEIGAF